MSLFGDGAKKVVELMREINQMSVRIEANDRETHRMLEEFKRIIEKYEARQAALEEKTNRLQQELLSRVTILEAEVKAVLKQAAMISAKEGAKEAMKEALAGGNNAEMLARAAAGLEVPKQLSDHSGEG